MKKLIHQFNAWFNSFMAMYPRLGIVAIVAFAVVFGSTSYCGIRAAIIHHQEVKSALCHADPVNCLIIKNTIKGRRNVFRTDNDDTK
jgi:hypothetical protein